ncbi:MAG: ribonuclease HII [Dehalococcoidales bacterium]|nr:ribonuclease HII [Dehalococcoidales bacterium]
MLSMAEEKALRLKGYSYIAGIDEVGRGPLAGPVVAAAIIVPARIKRAPWLNNIRDSKLLSAAQRERLYDQIQDMAVSFGVGTISSYTIDIQGIAKATRLAMKQAVEQLSPQPDYLLIDYVKLPEVTLPQKGIVDGDALCFSIACASIIAKVTRDRLMIELDAVYPGYGMANHKGYGTREHLECLHRLGPCPIHRHSFRPVKEAAVES